MSEETKKKQDQCFWPGCDNPPLCVSGNVNELVCSKHFMLINGSENPILAFLKDDQQEKPPPGMTRQGETNTCNGITNNEANQ